MARPLRLEFPGALYHITSRGNARQDIFLDRHDRFAFLNMLAQEIARRAWKCHAYCLMTNHYHLLLETPDANLVGGMKRLNGRFCQRFNLRHRRVGHVLQGRYHGVIVDREPYILELARYIVLNPVRAGMVRTPDAWRWSSYRATAGLSKHPDWLRVDDLLDRFRCERGTARAGYRRFVTQGIGAGCPWRRVKGQIWLGSASFLERMAPLVEGRSLRNVPGLQTRISRPDPERILESVTEVFATTRAAILERRHQAAFRVAVILWRRVAGLRLREISSRTGVSPSRISRIEREGRDGDSDGLLQLLTARFKNEN